MLTKIISGGQTGADQGGLAAAKLLGIQTGGTAPPHWMTEDGSAKELLRDFGLTEGIPDPRIYPKRTLRNVLDSDGTVVFGKPGSAGSRMTLRYCRAYGKPAIIDPTSLELTRFIDRENIHTLNVAGNRESKNSGIHERTRATLIHAVQSHRYPFVK